MGFTERLREEKISPQERWAVLDEFSRAIAEPIRQRENNITAASRT
jgi:hypothetical protein